VDVSDHDYVALAGDITVVIYYDVGELQPMDRRVNHYSARSHEVVGHWVKRGRPRTTTAPLQPSERRLAIDLGIQPQADDT